jgi:hypothetical protein
MVLERDDEFSTALSNAAIECSGSALLESEASLVNIENLFRH